MRTTISKQGNFTKTIAHQSYSSDDLNLLCQGYENQASESARFIFNVMKNSVYYLIGDLRDRNGHFKKIDRKLLGNLV